MKENKKNIIMAGSLTLASIIYTLLVKFVDVKAIGPNGSEVGFAWLNKIFHNLLGEHMVIYKISEVLGYVVMLLVVIYGCIGLYQLIKRKSLLKVDKEIIKLGVFYVLMLVVYVLFEKIEINYRPVLMDGVLEASYPSSHTILALCICFSSLITSKKYFNKLYVKKINLVTVILTGLVLLLRTISGVHWISDIIGGIIISLTLVSYYQLAYYYKKTSK